MSKSRPSVATPPGGAPQRSTPPPVRKTASATNPRRDNFRELIESIAIAFVLAFLFKTFEAEAFVIPTGSMAPTLMGRHKDVVCPKCGYAYRVNASDEAEGEAEMIMAEMARSDVPTARRQQLAEHLEDLEVVGCTCPMCRYVMNTDPRTEDGRAWPSYRGDRILVTKFSYEFAEPERFDIAVFKYPKTAKENYIKRLVGLPGETVRLQHGDLHTRSATETEFQIARKPPEKVVAMLQEVYDNDYVLPDLAARGVPFRWQPDGEGWKRGDDGRSFEVSGADREESWLRYHHIVPSAAHWKVLEEQPQASVAASTFRPQLVTDFYAYNAGIKRRDQAPGRVGYEPDALGLHWVGDLAIECELSPASAAGEVVLLLRDGGRAMTCRFDLASGEAALGISGLPDYQPRAPTSLRGAGPHAVRFANVDDKLYLWVDDETVTFDAPTEYPDLGNHVPTPDDLAPVGVSARRASVRIDDLRVKRDVYYIVDNDLHSQLITETGHIVARSPDLFSNPSLWDVFGRAPFKDFTLKADQFLMLGDNSPRSMDSRLWTGRDPRTGAAEYYVRRDLLVGKALFVYWPHALNKIPGTSIPFPYFPNFGRMTRVR